MNILWVRFFSTIKTKHLDSILCMMAQKQQYPNYVQGGIILGKTIDDC